VRGTERAVDVITRMLADPDGYTLLMQYSGYTPRVSKQPLTWAAEDLSELAQWSQVVNASKDRGGLTRNQLIRRPKTKKPTDWLAFLMDRNP
jgi:hypothetical protein